MLNFSYQWNLRTPGLIAYDRSFINKFQMRKRKKRSRRRERIRE
jgi:hypothetical protein